MNDDNTADPPDPLVASIRAQAKPPKRRVYRRRAAPPAVEAKVKVKVEEQFPGMSTTACPAACSEKGCVISGNIYCAHPLKGGLQAADMHKPAAIARYAAAKKVLQHAFIESK